MLRALGRREQPAQACPRCFVSALPEVGGGLRCVITHPRGLRAPNVMKHVCVAARIGDGKALDAGNIQHIGKSSNAASRGGRSRFQAYSAWMRPRSATLGAPIPRDSRAPARSHPRKRGPCSTLRCAADSGCNPYGLARVLACSPRLSAKVLQWGRRRGPWASISFVAGGTGVVPAIGPAANESRRPLSQATGLE
jgi:hypothetical protein